MPQTTWSHDDLRQLESRRLSIATAEHQLDQLHGGSRTADLDQPCVVGHGIQRLSSSRRLELAGRQRQAARAGRFSRFVPASGAASRMFGSLLHFARGAGRDHSWQQILAAAEAGDRAAGELVQALTAADRLPFRDELEGHLAAAGGLAAVIERRDHRALLAALLDADRMDCARQPKGLIPFHRYTEGPQTPIEEHLTEAAAYATAADGVCRLHFTVSEEHQEAFHDLLARRQRHLEEITGSRFEIAYSTQGRHTDTLAIDAAGQPARDPQGRLLFRPGGHGALLENLGRLEGEFVYVKNIDNIQPAWSRLATVEWKEVLGGLLVELQEAAHGLVRGLKQDGFTPQLLAAGEAFCRQSLDLPSLCDESDAGPDQRRRRLLEQLDRPLRVCGVVPNTGEPGGGPFWVRTTAGAVTPQIVESAQIDAGDPHQLRLFQQATHFNPVDLVCGLRTADGSAFDLARFVDQEAAIVTTKSVHGEEIRILELPGLWNGSMADWNTVFVEVPLATFTPVKTVLDLLRPEHQPA